MTGEAGTTGRPGTSSIVFHVSQQQLQGQALSCMEYLFQKTLWKLIFFGEVTVYNCTVQNTNYYDLCYLKILKQSGLCSFLFPFLCFEHQGFKKGSYGFHLILLGETSTWTQGFLHKSRPHNDTPSLQYERVHLDSYLKRKNCIVNSVSSHFCDPPTRNPQRGKHSPYTPLFLTRLVLKLGR